MVTRGWIVLLSLLLLGLWTGTAAALTVQAVTGQDQVALGESLQLQLQLDGSPDAEPDFTPLLENWEILSRSQSSQMQIINSSFKRSVVYSLTLMPRTEGTLMIPAVCFDKDCSLPLPIEVMPRSALADSTADQVLLEAEISPQKIVTQGQLLLKVQLWLRVGLTEGQLSEPEPTGVEALVKKLTDVRNYKERNGQRYQVIERDYAIFPQGGGQLQIPPLQFDGVIAGASSRLDPFARQGKRVRRTSQPLQVEVTPLPNDLGRRPWLPATSVVLQDDWQQQSPKLVVGEPATRTLRLSAGGVLSAQLPEIKPGVPAGFKVYPDQPVREDQLANTGVMGVMEQKIALVPINPGSFQLPAVDLDWWDLATGQWQQVHLAALDIEVAPAAGSIAPQPMSPPAPPSEDASREAATAESRPTAPLGMGLDGEPDSSVSMVWPWVSLGLALGWLLTLLLVCMRWRRLSPVAKESTASDAQLNEKAARRAALQAAKSNDPQATRQALLALSRILWPLAQNDSYAQFYQAGDPALLKELKTLDRCLYGRSERVWDGQGMVACLAALRPPMAAGTSGLPNLYPDEPAKY